MAWRNHFLFLAVFFLFAMAWLEKAQKEVTESVHQKTSAIGFEDHMSSNGAQ